MSWPIPSDYQEAIQNPRSCFADSELQHGSPELDKNGFPYPMSGNFASVYQLNCNGQKYAVRCFLRYNQDQKNRYAIISKHLKETQLPYWVKFEFLEHGIKVKGKWYPILKMEWVNGEPLNSYIEKKLCNPQIIKNLSQKFLKLIFDLKSYSIAHGDLQHGNILIINGDFRLVDYDGIYVPGFEGMLSHEIGHPNYQHPSRSKRHFGPYLDNFSAWVIYISLLALSVNQDLWKRLSAGDECLLFRKEDFETPESSKAMNALKQIQNGMVKSHISKLSSFLSYSESDISQIPFTVKPKQDPYIPPEPPRVTPIWIFDHIDVAFVLFWVRPGIRFETKIGKEPIYSTRKNQIPKTRKVKVPKTQIITVPVKRTIRVPVEKKVPVTKYKEIQLYKEIWGVKIPWGIKKEPYQEIKVELTFEERTETSYHERTQIIEEEVEEKYIEEKEERYISGHREVKIEKPVHIGGHSDRVSSLAFSHDGKFLISGSYDKTVQLWSVEKGDQKQVFSEHKEKVEGVVVGSSNISRSFSSLFWLGKQVFVSCSWDGTVWMWDDTGTEGPNLRPFSASKSRLYGLAISPDGRWLAAAAGQKLVYLWNLEKEDHGKPIKLTGHSRKVQSVAFTPDSKLLISASSDNSLIIWEILNPSRRRVPLYGHNSSINCVAVSPDGRLVASGDDDGEIIIWKISSGESCQRFQADREVVYALIFSPNGHLLASGGSESVIRIWQVKTSQKICELAGHNESIFALAFSPDGRFLASGSGDGQIRLWKKS